MQCLQDLAYLESLDSGYDLLSHLSLKNINCEYALNIWSSIFVVKKICTLKDIDPENKCDSILSYILVERMSLSGFYVVVISNSSTCLEILSVNCLVLLHFCFCDIVKSSSTSICIILQ
jgi:hypothetical protein